jgi:hypothetical protein
MNGFGKTNFSLGMTFAPALALIFLLALHSPAHGVTIFSADLTGSQEFPPNGSLATGFATFILNDAQTALTFQATIFGIDVTGTQTPGTSADNLVAAHIHCCTPPGANASVVWGFFGTPFNDNNPNDSVVIPFLNGVGGAFSGKWDLPEGNNTTLTAQLPGILAGNSYINFHTTTFPGGEIRGQITPVPEPATVFLIGFGMVWLIISGWRWSYRASQPQG